MAGGETWWTNKINLLNVYECNIDLIEQTGLLHKQGWVSCADNGSGRKACDLIIRVCSYSRSGLPMWQHSFNS